MAPWTDSRSLLTNALLRARCQVVRLGVCMGTSFALVSGPASASEKLSLIDDAWGLYLGAGYSGATSGRPVPGLHIAGHVRFVTASFFSTGTSSAIFSESYQMAHLGFPFQLFGNSWFQIESSFGLGALQMSLVKHGDSSSSDDRLDEQVIGLGQAVQSCFFDYVCLRLEGLYGLIEESTEQIFQETALGSLGVRL